MAQRLIVTSGPDQGTEIPLEPGQELVFGRGQEATRQLNDRGVSRRHLRLEVSGDAVTATDLGSTAGTLHNGARVDSCRLRPGDELRLGNTVLRYEAGPGAASPAVAAKRSGSNLDALQGTMLHIYKVFTKLHEGHSSVVFHAWDTNAERDVALKVLRPEVSGNEEDRHRFVRGMKTMFPVRHENIVRIHNAGKSEGVVWVAMEYFESESLTQVISRIGTAGMLDWRMAFTVALHMARALDAAYEHQIIHRNITPQNILWNREKGLAKLGDLMLAKALEGTLAQQVTKPGNVVGDLYYLSPERLEGDESRIDCRSDIYSLGATVYALLTGRPPFEARTLPDLVAMVRTQEPERPKTYQLAISDLFEGAVLQMLRKRPEDRYATPAALLKDLERIGRYQGIGT